jgi:hypothetical protein
VSDFRELDEPLVRPPLDLQPLMVRLVERHRPRKRDIVERRGELVCTCCGDQRLRYDNGAGNRWCDDCDEAGCDITTCRATADIVMARIKREWAEESVR